MTSADEDYATLERLAIYLEIQWSDYLIGAGDRTRSPARLSYPNPLHDAVSPNFPKEVAALAHRWASKIKLQARRVCDVGGATGRALFEIDRSLPDLTDLVLVEPSSLFCEWALRLLATDEKLPDFPLLSRVGFPHWASAHQRPAPIANAGQRLTIFNGPLEDYNSERGFDMVVCLNVVDRHASPVEIVNRIGSLMNPGGLLILSSPFDFNIHATPDLEVWIDDLNSLFPNETEWSHVGQDEMYYEYRSFNRSWTRFATQIVCKRWRAE